MNSFKFNINVINPATVDININGFNVMSEFLSEFERKERQKRMFQYIYNIIVFIIVSLMF